MVAQALLEVVVEGVPVIATYNMPFDRNDHNGQMLVKVNFDFLLANCFTYPGWR